jgi:hypothetical protein
VPRAGTDGHTQASSEARAAEAGVEEEGSSVIKIRKIWLGPSDVGFWLQGEGMSVVPTEAERVELAIVALTHGGDQLVYQHARPEDVYLSAEEAWADALGAMSRLQATLARDAEEAERKWRERAKLADAWTVFFRRTADPVVDAAYPQALADAGVQLPDTAQALVEADYPAGSLRSQRRTSHVVRLSFLRRGKVA